MIISLKTLTRALRNEELTLTRAHCLPLSPEQNKMLLNIIMYSMKESQAKFQEDLKEKDFKIKLLDGKAFCLENRIVKLENKLEFSASNKCLNKIILSGKNVPTHVNSENCVNVVRTVLHDKFL